MNAGVRLGRRPLLAALAASPLMPWHGLAAAQASRPTVETPQIQVGDAWRYEQVDGFSGSREFALLRTVTRVGADFIEGSEDAGTFRMSRALQVLESPRIRASEAAMLVDFPIEVGKRWAYRNEYANKVTGAWGILEVPVMVSGVERVIVPAGEFEAFKIEGRGNFRNHMSGSRGSFSMDYWFAPSARNVVQTVFRDQVNRTIVRLVELNLQP